MHLFPRSCQRVVMTLATVLGAGFGLLANCPASTMLDLSRTTVVVRSGTIPAPEQTAARVLVEEVRERTGLNWPISTVWPAQGSVIAISSGEAEPGWRRAITRSEGVGLPEHRPEGFRLTAERGGKPKGVVWIHGADSRGALFGVGELLRSLNWGRRSASVAA